MHLWFLIPFIMVVGLKAQGEAPPGLEFSFAYQQPREPDPNRLVLPLYEKCGRFPSGYV